MWETLITVLLILFFSICFLLIGGITVAVIVFVTKTLRNTFAVKRKLSSCPALISAVRVVSKFSNNSYSRTVNIGSTYYISFEFPDGSRKNFWIVDVAIFNTIVENEMGILTYKEHEGSTLFIHFQPQPR